jgi:hypothetical protein
MSVHPTRAPGAAMTATLAALTLTLAACADGPTAPAVAAAPRRALATTADAGAPSASFQPPTGCSPVRGTNTVDCFWAIGELANIPAGARIVVVSTVPYNYSYECVNARSGKPQKKPAGGSSNTQVTGALQVDDHSSVPISGQSVLVIAADPGVCGRSAGLVARLTGVELTGWTISALLYRTSDPTEVPVVIGSAEPGPAQP